MKKRVFLLWAAAGALVGCSDEPEVVVVEPVTSASHASSEATLAEAGAWDLDEDGLLGKEEFVRLSSHLFSTWDDDRDGTLTPTEFARNWTAAGFSQPAEAFRLFNSDESAVLRQKDLFNAAQWDEWDSDGSGVLEEAEFPFY